VNDDAARQLAGEQPEGDQAAFRRQDEVAEPHRTTDTELYEGQPAQPDTDTIEGLTELELREGETDDPGVAAEEGLAWVPPTDPPVVPDADDQQGAQVAAGFGATSLDEPYDTSHQAELMSEESDVAARVRDALRADAATSRYAEDLLIGTRGSTVVIRGQVDDLDDSDTVVEVASRVTGIDDVVDELEVRGI
jgi:hypothetical protein